MATVGLLDFYPKRLIGENLITIGRESGLGFLSSSKIFSKGRFQKASVREANVSKAIERDRASVSLRSLIQKWA